MIGSPASIADSALALPNGGVIGHVGMLAAEWDWMSTPPDLGGVALRFYNSETLET